MDLGVKPLSFTSSGASWKSNDRVSDQFPAGLRVLVVDDDPTCLRILEKMLRNCLYEATTCNRAEIALKFLRDNRNGYDIVISDVHMPDMDGFKLLEHVGLEMDLPVIMMSADDSKNVVMKGVTHGACDYLIKPVRMEALKNIWQHVVRKKKYEWKEKDCELSGSVDDGRREQKLPEDLDYSSSANEGTWRGSKKRKDEEDEAEERDDTSTLKKPRVVWSVELHQQFVTAVNQLGIDKAVPKKILELMSVPGLTRENVASHLQKYRLYLRRLSGVSQHPNGLSDTFLGPPDVGFGPMSSLNGAGLQAFTASGPLQPQSLATIQAAALGRGTTKPATPVSLVDQRHLFGLENSKLRFVEGQQQQSGNTKQVNLLHGIPTNMDSKQLATFRQSAQPFGNMNMQVQCQAGQSNVLLTPTTQLQSRTQTLNETNGSHVSTLPSSAVLSRSVPSALLSRNGMDSVLGTAAHTITVSQPSIGVDFSRSLSTEFPGNNFSVASNSGISSLTSKHQDEVNSETKGSRGFLLNYDVFDNLQQNRIQDWHFQNAGSIIKAHQHSNAPAGLDILPAISIPQQFSSNQWVSQSRTPFVKNTMLSVSEGFSSTPNTGGQQNFSPLSDNQLRIKAERLPDMGLQNGLFPEHFGQEDLMSALLKQHQEGIGPLDSDLGFDGYQLDNLPV